MIQDFIRLPLKGLGSCKEFIAIEKIIRHLYVAAAQSSVRSVIRISIL